MAPQHCYVGLDVSLEQTAVCVLDDAGLVVWRSCLPSFRTDNI